MRQDGQQWRVDKHIPITLILTILLQTAGLIWYTAKMDSRVEALERQTAVVTTLTMQMQDMNSRLVRIETLLSVRKGE